MSAQVVPIAEGVTAFCNTYEVNGRVSWHPPAVRGHAAANCYVVQDGDEALLIDTGLTVHGAALDQQLRATLTPQAQLSIMTLRQGEFDSVCNLLPLAEAFGVRKLYGQFSDIPRWADFHPAFDTTDGWQPGGVDVTSVVLARKDEVLVGARRLDVFRPLLRLLSTHWVYDEDSAVLFTSDSFSYVVRATQDGPWQVTDADDETTVEHVSDHLASTRYWWLPESNVDQVRRDLSDVFDSHRIEHIAPAFGAVISGAGIVERHFALMDESIARLGRSSAEAA